MWAGGLGPSQAPQAPLAQRLHRATHTSPVLGTFWGKIEALHCGGL